MQHVHLAQLYARMGYPDAALAEANGVRIASARMLCQIYCLLTAGHQAIDAHQLEPVARHLPEIEDLLQRGIECGALVDPWNIIGFGGNFSLFPGDRKHGPRFPRRRPDRSRRTNSRSLCPRLDRSRRARRCRSASRVQRRPGPTRPLVGQIRHGQRRRREASGRQRKSKSRRISWPGALSAWHKAGAAAGDVKFWRMFVDQFDSPKAFQLGRRSAARARRPRRLDGAHAAMGQPGRIHAARRWRRLVPSARAPLAASRRRTYENTSGIDQWPLVAKFFQHLEASAETLLASPRVRAGRRSAGRRRPTSRDDSTTTATKPRTTMRPTKTDDDE